MTKCPPDGGEYAASPFEHRAKNTKSLIQVNLESSKMAENMPRPPADYEIPMSNPTREISAGNLALVQMAEDMPRPPNKIWPNKPIS